MLRNRRRRVMSAPLSAYEEARLARVAENERMLIALGLETAVRQCRTPRPKPAASAPRKPKAAPSLTEEQRETLANAAQWLERFEVWLRGEVSQANADKTMDRVRELVSGQGVHLKGYGVAFEGRAVSIADDLVELKAEAAASFGPRGNGRDQGGWHLNHPIGKLLLFQQVLFASCPGQSGGGGIGGDRPQMASVTVSGGTGALDAKGGELVLAAASWLVADREVEVEMLEEGFCARSHLTRTSG